MKFVINIYDLRHAGDQTAAERSFEKIKKSLTGSYPEDVFHFHRIDAAGSENLSDHDDNLIEQIDEGALEIPLVTINDEIAADGEISEDRIRKWIDARK